MGFGDKRCLVLVDSFHLLTALTGTRTYAINLYQALEDHGKDLNNDYIIYPNWRKLDQQSYFRGRLSLFKKVLNHLSYFLWKQIALPIVARLRRADFVLSVDYISPYFKPGFKTVTVLHDSFFWDYPANYNRYWRTYFTLACELGISRKNIIVTTSLYARQRISKALEISLVDIKVAYQAPKPAQRQSVEERLITELGLEKRKYFLHVGYFDKRKNIPVLIEAFHQLKQTLNTDLKLLLVGSQGLSEALDDSKEIYRIIEVYSLEKDVICTGHVSDEMLLAAYQNATAFIFPSYDEGFGIPILEAQSYDLPVVVSDRGASMEIAGEGCLAFHFDDQQELLSKMIDILSPKLQTQLIENGHENLRRFSISSFVHSFDTVISESKKK
jgi:glycosyltransferase involved in cell wall biosynthesis